MMLMQTEVERAQALDALLAGRFPDERGRYGPFGGRYVPETLIPAHERLEAGARRWLGDADFQRELQRELREWAGRPTALTPVPQACGALGSRGVAQARGSGAHRRPQDQQCARAGAACAAVGCAPCDCRDRRRTARRRERRRLCSRRTAVHGVHGRRGHGAAGAERRSHAAARCDRGGGAERRSHAARSNR